ncbi:DNA primase [Mesorhizobium sp. CAU 1732]|uniref:DUF7146 domain-containing protein n=1 Tax=Mesorhizobium sp. CAU 1732 TaxID=3140358 RepID=UPI0032609040
MGDAPRIPQEAIEQARAFDVRALAERYGFRARASATGEAVGPCPGCGGTDRFSVNGRKNIWRCRQGAGDLIGGDAIALIQHVENCSFLKAVEILLGDLSSILPRVDSGKAEADQNVFREKERRRAFNLWRDGRPFRDNGPVGAYLAARAIDPRLARMPGAHCREHGDFPYWHHVDVGPGPSGGSATKEWRIVHRGPAMLWPITALDGHFLGLHVTWLDASGPKGKAEIFEPATGEELPSKKVRGSQKGGRIVLRCLKPNDSAAVGEGVESSLSWFDLADRPDVGVYAAVNLHNIAGRAARTFAHPTAKITRRDGRMIPVRVPGPDPRPGDDQSELFSPDPATRRLTLIGDADSDPIATQAAMRRATTRLTRNDLAVVTDWPPAGCDFNSLLIQNRP